MEKIQFIKACYILIRQLPGSYIHNNSLSVSLPDTLSWFCSDIFRIAVVVHTGDQVKGETGSAQM